MAAQSTTNPFPCDNHSFASTSSAELSDVPYTVDALTQNLLRSDDETKALSNWLDDSLALSAFFTASQCPYKLWQTSNCPSLSTHDLVDQVLDKKRLRRTIALQLGADIAKHCVPAVANILHSLGHECLCRRPAQDNTTQVADWLRQQVDFAVPEYLWHAGRTPFAKAHYLMALVEEVFRTLPISWSDAMVLAEDGETLSHALDCITQAALSAKVEPQAVVGAWAAKNVISAARISMPQNGQAEGKTPVLQASRNEDEIMPSPPDSEQDACLG